MSSSKKTSTSAGTGGQKTKHLGDKIQSSLVLKLNLQMIKTLIFLFISVDMALILLFVSFSLNRLYRDVIVLLREYSIEDLVEDQRAAAVIGFSIREPLPDENGTLALDLSSFGDFTEADPAIGYQFYYPGEAVEASFLDRLRGISFELILPVENANTNDSVTILSYPFFVDLNLLFVLLIVVLILQAFYVFDHARSNRAAVKSILAPLDDLTAATQTLRQVTEAEDSLSEEELDQLAGELGSIDASKLDKRLELRSDQHELQGLTAAINEMLERIRLSYQSQIRFVSDASHELRTPIAVIHGYISLLDRWGKEDEAIRDEAISAIKSEIESMKQLIEQLLFLARGENKSLKLNPESFDACLLADELVKEARLIDTLHPYELKIADSAYIYADKQLIKQALRILIDNAVKYSADKQEILIRVNTFDNKVSIAVQDSGIGIAPIDVPQIFNRFFRSDESRARNTGGSGLGLAIAQWIAWQHRGYYEVTSRVGIGTRISLILPQSAEHAPAETVLKAPYHADREMNDSTEEQ